MVAGNDVDFLHSLESVYFGLEGQKMHHVAAGDELEQGAHIGISIFGRRADCLPRGGMKIPFPRIGISTYLKTVTRRSIGRTLLVYRSIGWTY